MKKAVCLVLAGLALVSCANMPTNPTQITGSYVSDLKYAEYSCNELELEATNLSERELLLVRAQEQRISSSGVQAFWLGYGTGDGIEAAELGQIRGHLATVRRVMVKNNCKTNF